MLVSYQEPAPLDALRLLVHCCRMVCQTSFVREPDWLKRADWLRAFTSISLRVMVGRTRKRAVVASSVSDTENVADKTKQLVLARFGYPLRGLNRPMQVWRRYICPRGRQEHRRRR